MNYIFSSTDDLSAFWLFSLLQTKVRRLKLVTEEMLWYNRNLSFHINTSSSNFKVKLVDGTYISNNDSGLVINRLQMVPFKHSTQVQQEDLHYSMQESHAILFAVLASFEDKILNPPTPSCLYGNRLPTSLWLKKVIASGEEALDYPASTGTNLPSSYEIPVLIMFGELIFCNIPVPTAIGELCIKLSKWSNNPIIELIFLKRGEKWLFKSSELMPDFSRYLNPFNIDKIVKILNN